MADQLLTTFKQQISALSLQPSGGGCFEVTVDGELVYSKLETGQFPEPQTVIDALKT